MPVLKRSMYFGFLIRVCAVSGILTVSIANAVDDSVERATGKVASDAESGLRSDPDDPPLIDLSELLSLLGELPTLSELRPKTGIVGEESVDRTCDGGSETVKTVGASESNATASGPTTNGITANNPLRISSKNTNRGTESPKATSNSPAMTPSAIVNPGPSTNDDRGDERGIGEKEKVEELSQKGLVTTPNSSADVKKETLIPDPAKATVSVPQATNASPPQGATRSAKPLVLALELDLEESDGNGKENGTAPKVIAEKDSKKSEMTESVSTEVTVPEHPESAPKVTRTTLPSDPPTLMIERKDSGDASTETLELAELESIAELKAVPMVDVEDTKKTPIEVSNKPVQKEVNSSRKSGVDSQEISSDISKKETPKKEYKEPFQNSTQSRSRPKLVKVKPLTDLDQEAPNLDKQPSEIDSKQAREEDEKAVEAKRPMASKKSFVETPTPPATTKSTKPAIQQTPAELRRQQRVENCLAYYIANPETVVQRSPWAVMHAMLPFGVEGEVMVGNKRVNSIQWMCYNGTCRTQKMFTPVGKTFRPNVGGGVQGHEGQFLAMLAQSQVSADYPIVVGNNRYSVLDLVRYEMATCQERTELTFKLIALSYYVDTNQSWTAADRKRWNIEKLVEQELAQPIVGSACGGTHRLMGLTFALRQRKAEGRPIDGHYARAEKYIADYIDYAWTLQNPDGSFSTNWFESRGEEQNKERKVQTTGHILEWLMFTLPKEQLQDPRITKSVDFLLSHIWDDRNHKWPIGPRGHAERAIALYQQRVYGAQPGQRRTEMATRIESLKLRR